ncbi:sensor histidine kinase [Pulveribacter suum]|uniref:histidine kinase n=1 Tax=Pulveribacter suum TaxID=2116657 RepID=A0A2P1NP74_9BURK|nr:ATP-binding protein [Pulveribacter suum]AVP58796.1 two-component sensor histidine kinase [Pulveribacter suum]
MADTQALQQQLAQARQQLADMAAAQDAFMQRVVHDLGAPLRHVTSYGTLVRELLAELPPEDTVAEAQDCVATMEQSARRMALMLDGLRALADAGRAPLQLQPVDLSAALHEARTLLAASEAGRPVQWQVDDALPAVQADPALLRQLLRELLANALKFTRGREPARIAVRAQRQGERVHIAVQDNGAGFEPERAGPLFGVFERLHRESEFEGVGAGLALCQAIAQRHGARISATAQPGGGCTVQLDWPAA